MKNLYYILIPVCLANAAQAQHGRVKDSLPPAPVYTALHADARLDIVLKKRKMSGSGNSIYSGRGYRVQIYSGNDRNKATKIKIDFARRFPGVQTYMTYVSPQFRVKVGDFHTRGEAQEMYRQLSTLYNPCMIVPDIVVFRNINNKNKDDRSDTD